MANEYINPEDVSPSDAQKILDFLNSCSAAEQIAETVEFPREKDVGIRVGQRILDRRKELGGEFANLQQIADVEQVGPKRFTDIVRALSATGAPEQPVVGLDEFVRARSMCEEDFFKRPNLVAVAVGYRTVGGQETDELCIKAFVSKKTPVTELSEDQVLPSHVSSGNGEEVGVDVEEMAPPWAGICRFHTFLQAGSPDMVGLRERLRPAAGGFSVGHFRVTAGTIATVVRDQEQPGVFYILSNNHILANSNVSAFGDAVLQPGPADGGRFPQDQIARLTRCVLLNFAAGSTNLVDAAIAQIRFCDVDRRVFGIGYPQAIRRSDGIRLGEELQKTGRTTGYTRGRIIGLNGTINVNYGARVARFREQIITTPMSAGGDSGSLVLDLHGNALGLLFAGSSTNTVLNPIEEVQNQLGIVVADKTV